MFAAKNFAVSRRLILSIAIALAASSASANTIPVLNGDFEQLYKGTSTTVTPITTQNVGSPGPSGFFVSGTSSGAIGTGSLNTTKGNGGGIVNWSDGTFTASSDTQSTTFPGWHSNTTAGVQLSNGISAPGILSVFIQGPIFGGPSAGNKALVTSTVGATQIAAGHYYQLTIDAAANNGTATPAGGLVLGLAYATSSSSNAPTVLPTSGTGITTNFTEGSTQPGTSWATYTITYSPAFFASQGIIGDWLYPQFGALTVANGDQNQYDNVQLQTFVPEPSTWVLGLLGAVGLAVLAKGRKRVAS